MDHEYIAIVPELFDGDMPMTIGVDKVGGGTLGSTYNGTWEVTWYDNGDLRASSTLTTGTAKRHDHVAAIAGQFFTGDLDTDTSWDVYDRVSWWAGRILNES